MTPKHEPFDETAKPFYHHFFKNRGIKVEFERKVFSCSRKIDLLVKCTDANRLQLQNTIFAHFRQINALELKGVHDPLTVSDHNLIVMRAYGLGVPKYQTKPCRVGNVCCPPLFNEEGGQIKRHLPTLHD